MRGKRLGSHAMKLLSSDVAVAHIALKILVWGLPFVCFDFRLKNICVHSTCWF